MDIEHYLTTRPFAYHTTAAANLASLRATRSIESTARLFMRAGRQGDPVLGQRRVKSVLLPVAGGEIVIRDQSPLAEGAIALDGGWTFADLVRHLNGLVFLWPGDHRGPSGDYGRNHFARYEEAGEALAVLRIPTRALLRANPMRPPRFSRYNSGATRCHPSFQATKGRVPRGPTTFRTAGDFEGSPPKVAELVFEDHVLLPGETECTSSFAGPWAPFV